MNWYGNVDMKYALALHLPLMRILCIRNMSEVFRFKVLSLYEFQFFPFMYGCSYCYAYWLWLGWEKSRQEAEEVPVSREGMHDC